jgi:predicted nucleic acid-binding protein
MSLVLDNSVAMLWLLPQSNPQGIALADYVLMCMKDKGAVVPSLWSIEAANVIAKSQRLEKITGAKAAAFIELLSSLAIRVDECSTLKALHETLHLATRTGLSAYDAAYLELAMRLQLPLATLDKALARAALDEGVELVQMPSSPSR